MLNPEYDYQLKIALFGNENTGKSQLLLRWVDNLFNNGYSSTIGVEFKIKNINYYDKRIRFLIWDTSGKDKFRQISGSYVRGTDLALICIAANETQQQKIEQ